MRLMGLDYGSKTVGVALSDPLLMTAEPLETIVRKEENHLRRTLARIAEIVREYEVTEIVLGNPLYPSGDESERSAVTRAFKEQVEKRTGLPVAMFDERLTTVEADEALSEMGVKAKDRKKYIDQVAACLILKDYMGSLNGRKGV
jgi:putative Holliday junction resolvase